jgi:hypothetical protein
MVPSSQILVLFRSTEVNTMSNITKLSSVGKSDPDESTAEPEIDFDVEVSSAANVMRFFEEYFNLVGDGHIEVKSEDGYAMAHVLGLCSKRLYSIL